MLLLRTILIGGLVAFVFFILSVACAWKSKHPAGLAFAFLELLAASVSSAAWMYALKVSGKTDWYLLGLFRYTPIALIFISMFVVGAICVIVNVRGIIKSRK